MTSHARAEGLLAAAIDFNLTPAEHTEMDDHIATCPDCRALAAGYRSDTASLRAMAYADPPARVRSAVLRAASRPQARAIEPWKLLVAAALLLTALLGATAAIGAWNSRPSLVVVPPIASPSADLAEVPTPTAVAPSADALSSEPTPFAPPAAECPSPTSAVPLPVVTVSVGGGPAIAATQGSTTTVTCTTTGSADAVPSDPAEGVSAGPGDLLTLAVPSGWRFLHWQGSDRPVVGEGANVWPPTDTPERPRQIEVPVPVRSGDSIAAYDLWIISDDGRVIGQMAVLVRVSVSPTASPPPSFVVPPVSALHWETEAAIADSHIKGLIGFRDGYVAYGTTGPELRPAAWFSADGRSWKMTELAGLAPCADSEPSSAGYVTTGATNGDQVVLVGARWPGAGRLCGETWAAAWVTSNGLDWQAAEVPAAWQGSFEEADGIWATPSGWEAFIGTDLAATLWQSPDGLTWQSAPGIPNTPEAGLASVGSDPNGVGLMAVWTVPPGSDQVMRVLGSSDGSDWEPITLPPGEDWTIQKIVPPSSAWSGPWVVITNGSGHDAVVRTTVDLTRWTSAPFPMPAVEDMVPTRYGLLAVGIVPCTDMGGPCPAADRTQFVSQDGLAWTGLTTSVDAVRLADGPAGVIGVGQATEVGTTDVWRLVETPTQARTAPSASTAPTNAP
jgi:hypothetical protein